jgi:hypothetical protein
MLARIVDAQGTYIEEKQHSKTWHESRACGGSEKEE